MSLRRRSIVTRKPRLPRSARLPARELITANSGRAVAASKVRKVEDPAEIAAVIERLRNEGILR
jgi:hypothetical protein